MKPQPLFKRIELRFLGACSAAAGVDRTIIEIRGSEGELQSIMEEIAGRVAGRIPYIALRDGVLITTIYAEGASLANEDVVTVVPVVLGG